MAVDMVLIPHLRVIRFDPVDHGGRIVDESAGMQAVAARHGEWTPSQRLVIAHSYETVFWTFYYFHYACPIS